MSLSILIDMNLPTEWVQFSDYTTSCHPATWFRRTTELIR